MQAKVPKIKFETFCISILLLLSLFSCNKIKPGPPLYNPAFIVDSFQHFWTYWYYDVNLSQNYVVFDSNNEKVNKKEFLKKLTTGNYLPLKLKSDDPTTNQYRLIKFKKLMNRESRGIYKYLAFFGRLHLKYFDMEGKPVPQFSFQALNGKTYTNENCKGKFIVLDCWFVGCKACVEDMPEINKLVEKYNNKDIVFIGLALNSEESVKKFLTKVELKYTVAPGMKIFIEDSLKVIMYPTYIVINKEGNIVGFPSYIKNLKSILNQFVEAGKLTVN